jgi:hypothetical protein
MTIVDRSSNPVLVFDYEIPFEDPNEDWPLSEDEVDQSRTHQFLAFCRDRINLATELPDWLTETDSADAEAHGLNTSEEVLGPEDHLETNTAWSDCWTRITLDADRRPITFEASADPVVWDTTGLAAGAWHIEGYTYEPWFNIWTQRPGVVKVVDDPDPAASSPAAALERPDSDVVDGTSFPLRGCVDGMAGTTMTISWATIVPASETPDWQPFVSDEAVDGSTFELEFDVPEAIDVGSLWFRIDLSDPMERTYTGYSDWEVGLVPTGSTTGICLDPEGCEEESGESGEGTTVDPGSNEQSSCACANTRPAAPAFALLVVVACGILPTRRRRA